MRDATRPSSYALRTVRRAAPADRVGGARCRSDRGSFRSSLRLSRTAPRLGPRRPPPSRRSGTTAACRASSGHAASHKGRRLPRRIHRNSPSRGTSRPAQRSRVGSPSLVARPRRLSPAPSRLRLTAGNGLSSPHWRPFPLFDDSGPSLTSPHVIPLFAPSGKTAILSLPLESPSRRRKAAFLVLSPIAR